ncbi:MAG: phosphoadenylyl-sulfate reductase, partial [Betaproteobacteria bacterium HGW-Betaproteobacteria-2]
MNGEVSFLRPAAANPATSPELTDALRAAVEAKSQAALALLQSAVDELGQQHEVTFANSFGAEDMVLTDLILRNKLPIEIFSLDTGRLPTETYDLMAETEKTYATKLRVLFPRLDAVENYVQTHGINAFYESIELRKACCHMRKVEPLQR